MLFSTFIIILGGLWIYSSSREHLLSTLLSLEFMVLGIFFLLLISFSVRGLYYSLFYLVITACEGALGLSVLVIIRRSHGGDYFKSFAFFVS